MSAPHFAAGAGFFFKLKKSNGCELSCGGIGGCAAGAGGGVAGVVGAAGTGVTGIGVVPAGAGAPGMAGVAGTPGCAGAPGDAGAPGVAGTALRLIAAAAGSLAASPAAGSVSISVARFASAAKAGL